MSLNDILKAKAQAPSKTKSSKEVPGDVSSFKNFYSFLHENGVRTTYTGCHNVAYLCKMIPLSEVGKPSAHRVINCLPLEQQYLVARNNGTYSEKASSKWGEVAPEGYADLKLVKSEDIEELYEAWTNQVDSTEETDSTEGLESD